MLVKLSENIALHLDLAFLICFSFHCILVHRNAGFMAFYFPSQHQFVAGKFSSEKNEYPGSQLNCSSVLLLELM